MATDNNTYFYKMTDDTGLAPCVDGAHLLTLAVCARYTRPVAAPGDYVIGFSSNCDGARLVYAAKVSVKLRGGVYWGARYAQRLDCVYEDVQGRAVLRKGRNVEGHNTQVALEYDIGARFEHGDVLLSRDGDFCYLGAKGTDEYAKRYPSLRNVVLSHRRRHRVNHEPEVAQELGSLIRWLWSKHGPGVHGEPTRPMDRGNRACGRAPKPRSCRSGCAGM